MSGRRRGGAAAAQGELAAPAANVRELLVPLPQPGTLHLCVEYPGYVGDELRVLDTLGGLQGIARHLQENPKSLPLRLRPDDLNCRANFARRDVAPRLLLKLTRPAGGGSGGGTAGWTAEVVADLQYSFSWQAPADYQYIAHDSRPIEGQGLELQEGQNPPGFQPQTLLCPPPVFAKQPHFDYAFRGNIGGAAGGAAGGGAGAAGGRKKAGTGVMASFFDVPQPLPDAALAAAQQHHPAVLRLLRGLLQQRAVWPAAALHDAVAAALAVDGVAGGTGRYPTDDLLPKLCYKFRNGPWKNAWTRRGFDPRADPSARHLQCLEYHLPSEWYSKIAERKKAAALSASQQKQQQQGGSGSGPASAEQQKQQEEAPGEREEGPALPPLAGSYRQLLRFEAVPSTQSCSLQLGGMGDSVVQQLLQDPANHAQHCSDSSGWLASAAHEAIKRRVKARFLAVLDSSPIPDDGGSFRAAAEAMQQGGGPVAGPQPMQLDAAAPAASSAGGPAEAAASPQPMDTDAAQAQHAQQGMQAGAPRQQQRQQQAATPPRAAAVAAAGSPGGSPGAARHILPTSLLSELHDYLAALPGQEDDGEESSDGSGYGQEDGEHSQGGAGGGQSEEE